LQQGVTLPETRIQNTSFYVAVTWASFGILCSQF
jgi:hypothetical protein